ncbi:MAG: mechanosensitive ion channel family protein [Methylotenera sp.]|uniref:mechanosensitive ion channel family protein n=1 Tax=Methylotenera sp. TaxID=2051956 RepID=UPI00271CB86F|nr:mechanosensitive ion channel family protein [Methylotenera sp.]MDO9151549.1 mechanosensitive ion channel family protein [Methylotenera sp.]
MENILTSIGFSDPEVLWALIKTILRILLILSVAGILMKLSSKLIMTLKLHLKERASDDIEEMKRIDTVGRVFRYIATIVVVIIAIVEVLHELGISIAPILAAAGVVGVAVGFGAQSLIKDYFNGFFLLLENQIRQGDVVDAGGKAGLVEEVTLRYIKMRDYSGNVHFVPNGTITTVTNMSRGFANAVIDVGVAYRENIDEVIQVMKNVGEQLRNDQEFKFKILDTMEMAGVEQLDNSSVVIRCRFKVLPLEQWGVKRQYLKLIKAAFDQQGIEIPYPHLTIYPGQYKDGSVAFKA